MFLDPIVLGAIAGAIGNVPKAILTNLFQYFGWVRYTFGQLAAGLFMKQEVLSNPLVLLVGYVTDFTVASLLGVVLVYIIRNTGNDFEIFKGLLIGLASYIFLYGIMLRLHITSGNLATPLPNFLALPPHIIFGMLSGWVIKHYGVLEEPTT